MASIYITGVGKGDKTQEIHFLVTQNPVKDDKLEEEPLGGNSITVANDMTLVEKKKAILEAAKAVLARNKEAKVIRDQLNKTEYGEIEK